MLMRWVSNERPTPPRILLLQGSQAVLGAASSGPLGRVGHFHGFVAVCQFWRPIRRCVIVLAMAAAPPGNDGEVRESVDKLMEALQAEVRAIATRRLRRERVGHTLQPTALVNEAYLRLLRQANLKHATPEKFLAAAAKIIRRILVDHARKIKASKRGGGQHLRVTLRY